MKNTKKLNKIVIVILILLCLLSFIIFFYITKSKKMKIGNNTSSQEIINNILNISSYEAIIEVEVNSNKNNNKYLIKQIYKDREISEQEILEPENIKGIKITRTENELKVENTKLNISKIYNDYKYIIDNCIDLNVFIELYKQNQEELYKEKNNEIILETKNNENIYTKYRELYISKETGKPIKMEIKDNSKNTSIYILYKEVKLK